MEANRLHSDFERQLDLGLHGLVKLGSIRRGARSRKQPALRLMNLLGSDGIHITYGAMGRRPLTVPNGLLIFKNLQLRGLWITKWIEGAPDVEIREVYGSLAAAMATGALRMPVDRVVPLEEFGDAIARLSEAGRNGKVLLGM